MPEGYTTSDIEGIEFGEDLLIEFKDKTIYFAEKNNLSEIKLNEELTTLNKKGKIKAFEFTSTKNYVLLSEGLYDIDM